MSRRVASRFARESVSTRPTTSIFSQSAPIAMVQPEVDAAHHGRVISVTLAVSNQHPREAHGWVKKRADQNQWPLDRWFRRVRRENSADLLQHLLDLAVGE